MTVALLAAPVPVLAVEPAATTTPGIDVSHHQGEIDWNRVAAANKRFAFLKASDGRAFVDPMYGLNRARAMAAGIRVGAYHFARPDDRSGDARAEADHFVATATIADGDLPPVLDLERSGDLSVSALRRWVRQFLDRIHERTGVRGAIYASPSFWSRYLNGTTWFAANGYRTMWVAHWTSAGRPNVPATDWAGFGWTFWQTTSNGAVDGIVGRVDLDRFAGSDLDDVLIDADEGGLRPIPDAPFEDTGSSKFERSIAWLHAEGITAGCSSQRFCPDGRVTRGQMAAFVARAMGLPRATKDYFDDDEGSTHEADINRLARAGLTSGCGKDRYCPGRSVTRGQLASFLARVLDLSRSPRDYFRDDERSSHESNINRIRRAGLTGGCSATRFCPSGALSRGQMAAFLHRTFDP